MLFFVELYFKLISTLLNKPNTFLIGHLKKSVLSTLASFSSKKSANNIFFKIENSNYEGKFAVYIFTSAHIILRKN